MAAISSAPREHAESDEVPRTRPWILRLALLVWLMGCDALAINGALIGVFWWLYPRDLSTEFSLPENPQIIIGLIVLANIAFIITFFASGLYAIKRGASRIDEVFKTIVAVSLGTFATFIINSLLLQFGGEQVPINGTMLVIGWAAAISATSLLRLIYREFLAMLRRRGIDARRVLILGAREQGQVVLRTIRREPDLGYQVQGFLSDSVPVGTLVEGVPVLGKPTSIGRVIRVTAADEVIIALSGRSSGEVLDIVALAEDEAVEIKLYPDVFQLVTNNEVSVGDVSGLPLLSVKNVALDSPINQALKRTLDVVVAAIVMTLFSPIMLLIAALIRLESPGPVFFVQERVGLDGRPFPCIKFRGMRQDAEAMGSWTTQDDPRVTRLGAFLRRYSLDELPQFMNVLRGEMSIVGPRPEQPMWVEKFSQSIPRYVRRHKQKAGITGWAQVNGLRGDTSIEERTRYDLYYIENWSLLFDVKIIIKTAARTLTGKLQGY